MLRSISGQCRGCPALALKADDAGQIGIAFEQRRERGINPPENFRVAEMQFQQSQHRQRLDHVAERTGFENENFQKASVAGVSKGGHTSHS